MDTIKRIGIDRAVICGSHIYVKRSDGKVYSIVFPSDEKLPNDFLVKVHESRMTMEQLISFLDFDRDTAS